MKKILILLIPIICFFGCDDDSDNNSILGYNCVNYNCIAEEDGQYITLADCKNECSEPISIFQSCLDAQGTWTLTPECPPYEMGAPFNIYVDVEDRFEDTIEILCIDANNQLVIEFYGQLIYANIDIDGNLEIPSQIFQGDFSGKGLDAFLDDEFFLDIQVTGDGTINNDYGVLDVDFSFTLSEDMAWEDMTNCTILLSR